MDNFTKKKLKKPSEIIDGIKSGDFSVTKRKFDLEKSKKTVKEISKDGNKIKEKVEDLKEVHQKITDKDSPEKKRFIKRKMPGKK